MQPHSEVIMSNVALPLMIQLPVLLIPDHGITVLLVHWGELSVTLTPPHLFIYSISIAIIYQQLSNCQPYSVQGQ